MRSAILATLALATATCSADNGLISAYSLGAGAGVASLRGDLVESRSRPAVGGGIDFHSERVFFLARGYTTTDNSGKGSDFAIGVGNKWIKAGLSYGLSGASVPTRATPVAVASGPLAGIVTADSSRKSEVRLSALAPYVRITPIHTRDTLLNLDLWYGIATSGEEKIPVRVFGLDGHLKTEPTKVGGMMGGALQLTRRFHKNGAVFAGYQWRTGRQDGGKASVSGDMLGLYHTVPVHDLKITTHALMLGLSLVNE